MIDERDRGMIYLSGKNEVNMRFLVVSMNPS